MNSSRIVNLVAPLAGLVIDRPEGTRRLYRLHDEGIEAVRAYLEQVWGDAAARFKLLADN